MPAFPVLVHQTHLRYTAGAQVWVLEANSDQEGRAGTIRDPEGRLHGRRQAPERLSGSPRMSLSPPPSPVTHLLPQPSLSP